MAPPGRTVKALKAWFKDQGWKPFPFQLETWEAMHDGHSGLIHAPTGVGKTLAAWGGALAVHELFQSQTPTFGQSKTPTQSPNPQSQTPTEPKEGLGIRVLWITPLRALAQDTADSLARATLALGLNLAVEVRTGDTKAAAKKRQRQKPPFALVTTPESLSLLLSYPECREYFGQLETVIVDEWHELLGSKRGVQVELGLARLRRWCPFLRVWGLSATIGNLSEALHHLLGRWHSENRTLTRLIQADIPRSWEIQTLIPPEMENFPWSGHLGLKMLPQVIESIENGGTTLMFTNTRSQAEAWFGALREARPDWSDQIGIHHGSIDPSLRAAVEKGLDHGLLRAAVCTSSLDLGVDFSPVDQVIQIGSPKGIARLLQRAGRSGHRPGARSLLIGVPTNAFELLEFAAARTAIEKREVESRKPVCGALDVLSQHLLTCALGTGFTAEELYMEITGTAAYADLEEEDWRWLLSFVSSGGNVLKAYPEYRRLEFSEKTYRLTEVKLARRHRLSIGTITSDSEVQLKRIGGGIIGSVEESFVSRLKPGDGFSFAGQRLTLVRIQGMTATVRVATKKTGTIPSWQGGRSPLSTELAEAVLREVQSWNQGPSQQKFSAELKAVNPLLEIQKKRSALPESESLLIEKTSVRGLHYLFVFPFAGRMVNEGLATLVAWRWTRQTEVSIRITANDYGFSLEANQAWPGEAEAFRPLWQERNLESDLLACTNATELAKRQFREIARVAGLVQTGFPGQAKPNRQIQISSSLLFDVFQKYDPGNKLVRQAHREIMERQLEWTKLQSAVKGMNQSTLIFRPTGRLTPFAFPLWADQLASRISSEDRDTRIRQMLAKLS